MSQTKPIGSHEEWTPHGPVEYDTVECTNCGDEIVVDAAVQVAVGIREIESRSYSRRTRYDTAKFEALCPYCAENVLGYTGEPTGVRAVTPLLRQWYRSFRDGDTDDQFFMIVMGLMMLLVMSLPLMLVVAALT